MHGRLTQLQSRILDRLAGTEPRWTLTGGGALVGFHTAHRTTRDLDLFFHGLDKLGAATSPGFDQRRLELLRDGLLERLAAPPEGSASSEER